MLLGNTLNQTQTNAKTFGTRQRMDAGAVVADRQACLATRACQCDANQCSGRRMPDGVLNQVA